MGVRQRAFSPSSGNARTMPVSVHTPRRPAPRNSGQSSAATSAAPTARPAAQISATVSLECLESIMRAYPQSKVA